GSNINHGRARGISLGGRLQQRQGGLDETIRRRNGDLISGLEGLSIPAGGSSVSVVDQYIQFAMLLRHDLHRLAHLTFSRDIERTGLSQSPLALQLGR